ncbi:MAG: hypothetical protein Q8K82_09295, partial [Gemmatimonadaceae bacterium]|nr:hypothetical protein [Gemmatimonadaceae bacterium]
PSHRKSTANNSERRPDTSHRAPARFARTSGFGVVAGAGVGVALGRRMLTLGARYEWGLRPIGSDAVARRRVLSYLVAVEWPVR